jgi:hypothetical protein
MWRGGQGSHGSRGIHLRRGCGRRRRWRGHADARQRGGANAISAMINDVVHRGRRKGRVACHGGI